VLPALAIILRVVRLLLAKDVDIELRDAEGETALHQAAGKGQDDVVRLLLNSGAEVSGRKNDGSIALHLAARWGHESTVRLLLERGANAATQDDDEMMPQHVAANYGHGKRDAITDSMECRLHWTRQRWLYSAAFGSSARVRGYGGTSP